MSSLEAPLDGKVAVVTGAGRGIGRAIALAYADAGAAVACGARSTDQIESVVGEIEAGGGVGLAVPTDVTDREQVETLVWTAVEALGGVDLVVCNAGAIEPRAPVDESVPEEWWHVIDVNLRGAYLTARAAIPHLKDRGGGKIITVGSGGGRRPFPTASAYSASKAALSMLTRTLAIELRPASIAVNELVPGPVRTEMFASLAGSAPPVADGAAGFGGDWFKDPEDVAPLALFLATLPDRGPSGQTYSLMGRDG